MFSGLVIRTVLIIIVILVLVVSGYYFFNSENKFDIVSIKEKLTSGNRSLFQAEIKWVEQDGKLIGLFKIDKLKSDVTYILQNQSIETISVVEKSKEIQDKIPCLNLVHLLSRKEVKNFYEIALKDINSTKEAYKVPVNNKMFIDYYQKESLKGLELHCKMYYTN